MIRRAMLTSLLCLGGCSLLQHSIDPPGPSIAEATRHLPAVKAPAAAQQAKPSAADVLALYQDVVNKVNDRELRYRITQRISSLQLEQANTALTDGQKASFGKAIATLQELLDDPHSKKDTGELRYKLAYAYDLSGSTDKMLANLDKTIDESPEQLVRLEARFRRAELMFSRGRYHQAASDYAVVSEAPCAYQLHALYMLGWSYFKLGQLDLALKPMVKAMDMLYDPQTADEAHQKELLQDLTRVAVITLDYLKGPKTLAQLMATDGKPAWQMQLYSALAKWYQKKRRFQDSAHTWETFLHENPMYVDAPRIALRVIGIYRDAGFVDDIDQRKRNFVLAYDKSSAFYKVHGQAVFPTYWSALRGFVEDLAANAHAHAQHTGKPADYLAAADWYEKWRANFAGSPGSDKMLFLEAQALEGAHETKRALAIWRTIAANYPKGQYGRDASYAIVVDLEAMAKETGKPLTDQRIAASLAFARAYPNDKRAPATQVSAAKMRFDAGNYRAAENIADAALKKWPLGDLWRTAALISSHSHFALGDYAMAEAGYRALLEKSPGDKAIKERLMAAVLKQGQAAETAGNLAAAIDGYKRLVEIDPTSKLAVDAAYDMAALYEKSGQLAMAARQLAEFRKAHPDYPETPGIAMRLATLDERLSRYGEAADELVKVHAQSPDAKKGQVALYHAGELYLKANENTAAIDTFRNYAHDYTSPLGLRLEAMQHLDELYVAAHEPAKRNFWLRQKVAAFDAAKPAEINERARYLAADAAFVLAGDKMQAFEAIRLKLPLKRALHRKQKALTAAVAAYKKVAGYGVDQFVNASTFNIAQIYQSLAQSIVKSQRPPGLNKLEQAQYELLLEDQADPFVTRAIDIFDVNLQRAWQASWDEWVDKSLKALAELSPGRFKREEAEVAYARTLY